jgi:monoamine oxidase
MERMRRCDVVVLGAGMAGLSAARALAEAGLRVIVLEAEARLGGRIRTVLEPDGVAIELGAEFIHGRPPDLLALLDEAGLETYERTGRFMRREASGLVDAARADEDEDVLQRLKAYSGPDRSFAGYLDSLHLPAEERAAELGYVEGFNAADAREASVLALGFQQAAEDEIEGDRVSKVRGGLQQIPAYLAGCVEAAGGIIVLAARATEVRWQSARGVEVVCADGRLFSAGQIVVALPLGVLQAGGVSFSPEPEAALDTLRRLRMGPVCRWTLLFDRRLWPDEMSFLISPDHLPGVWWTGHPEDERTLTGWVGGPRALPMLALPGEEQERRVIAAAAGALGVSTDQLHTHLVSAHSFDWSADPSTRGAYSWVPVGGLDASRRLSEPVEDVLFFAGEHTDLTGNWGTMHAALRSGRRAAAQLLASLPAR